jgi:hypothetical protein
MQNVDGDKAHKKAPPERGQSRGKDQVAGADNLNPRHPLKRRGSAPGPAARARNA